MKVSYNEFHISKTVRDKCDFDQSLFTSSGNVVIENLRAVRIFTEKLNKYFDALGLGEKRVSAGQVNAMGMIDEVLHFVSMLYRRDALKTSFEGLLARLDKTFGKEKIDALLLEFSEEFPPTAVYKKEIAIEEYLSRNAVDEGTGFSRGNREATFEEMIMLHLANENPAFKRFNIMFDDTALAKNPLYAKTWEETQKYFEEQKRFGPFNNTFITFLREPMAFSPNSLRGQLKYILQYWGYLIGEWLKRRILASLDTLSEEEKAAWQPIKGGEVELAPYTYENLMNEYERFSPDRDWMPKVVLMAKTILVWLDQLSKKYKREINRLDQIPDEELDILRDQGFTGLWLIGLWERSNASRRIKQICGNPEAASSAYSLMDYNIAENLGGWGAVDNLRRRLWARGIRLASDMVPNHTAMDSHWVVERPDLFIQRRDNPFPQYSFEGENLSYDGRVGVYLENHYYSKTDCAVVFKRVDHYTGDTRYIYHGNDGTGMPWNDTAQLDFLNPETREAVIQEILHVARNFPIIRFDAAMVLAKKHIRRLWYPEPGHGGDIATRSESSISLADFENAIPNEFWREVVDRVAQEVPDTLLLAEAFWLMEGYFVRTLGMHRVYNSAFMNMLKKEQNQNYRDAVKNTIKFDPEILKRYVNFMNNPDEETAVAQFGKGDKYFGVCTLMVTMPGLPMFGHGQIEGFEEKYGMEYTKAYRDEKVDEGLVDRHRNDIFPLMKKRYLFAQVDDFLFYDVWDNSHVNENIFAYSNRCGDEYAVVFYNNKYERASGWIKQSCEYAVKDGDNKYMKSRSISEGLGLLDEDDKYLIFREQRSNLWYIRKSSEICRNGMFISLNGFECQVMLDIHQVSDTLDKKWSTLCSMLNGRGCYNLDVEWEEYRYNKLYVSLRHFTGGSFFKDAVATIYKPSPAAIRKFINGVKSSGLAFYRAANTIAAEEAAFIGKKKINKKTAQAQFEGFQKTFELLCKIWSGRKWAKVPATALKRRTCILCGREAGYTSAEILVANAIALNIAENTFSARWSLDRKFAEQIQQEGLAVPNLRDILYRGFALTKLPPQAKFEKKNRSDAALHVAKFILRSPYAVALSRANTFDNIVWFNKEEVDRSLFLWALNEFLAGPNTEKEIVAVYKVLSAAQEAAEYKCDEFIALLEAGLRPPAVRRKTPQKKAAAKKPVAKKPASPVKKASAKTAAKASVKPAAKKPAAKPTAKKEAVAKKPVAAKKPAAKATKAKPATKAAAKPTTSKKPATKAVAKKTAAKVTAKKPVAKKAAETKAAKKPVAKPSAKATTKKPVAKTAAKKPAVKQVKPAAKKETAKKPAAKAKTKNIVAKEVVIFPKPKPASKAKQKPAAKAKPKKKK